jgi:hypothetical protein
MALDSTNPIAIPALPILSTSPPLTTKDLPTSVPPLGNVTYLYICSTTLLGLIPQLPERFPRLRSLECVLRGFQVRAGSSDVFLDEDPEGVYMPVEDVNVIKMWPLQRVIFHGYHHYSNHLLAIPTRRLELHLEHRLYYRAIEQLHAAVEIGVGIFGSNAMDGKSTEVSSRWNLVDTIFIKVKIPRLSQLPAPEPMTCGIFPQSNRPPVGLPPLSWQEVMISKSAPVLKPFRVICQRRGIALEVDILDEWSITQEVITTVL